MADRPAPPPETLTRRALPALVAAGLALSGQVQSQTPSSTPEKAPTGDSRRVEAKALRRFAETTHPRGRDAAADPRWQAEWEALDAQADAMTEATYLMALTARLAWFADGHTTLYMAGVTAPGFDLTLPIAVRPFYDGLLVVAAREEALPLLGARVARVDGVASEDLIRRFARDWPGNNPAWAHHDAGLAFTPAILRGVPLTTAQPLAAPVQVEGELNGRAVRASLRPRVGARDDLTRLTRTPSTIESWRPAGSANFIHRQDGAIYIAFDDLSAELAAILQFVGAAFAAMDDPSAQRVILDLRRNGGGNNFFGEGLRKYLERSRFNRPGGLYVLIGPQTFSAAQNLASRLERETYGVFVGEPTGGAPNHYGDAAPFVGQGFRAGVSTAPWFDSYPADKRVWIMPDVISPARIADWIAGRDPALDTALTHQTEIPLNDLSQSRTFVFARSSQQQAWTPFWAG